MSEPEFSDISERQSLHAQEDQRRQADCQDGCENEPFELVAPGQRLFQNLCLHGSLLLFCFANLVPQASPQLASKVMPFPAYSSAMAPRERRVSVVDPVTPLGSISMTCYGVGLENEVPLQRGAATGLPESIPPNPTNIW